MLSAKTRLGAVCGSDHEFHIAKFRFKLKKVGKTTRPFMYDLNQSGSDKYIQGIRSDRMSEELWMEAHYVVQEAVIKTTPKKKKCQMAKWLSDEALQIAEKRREMKEKKKDIPI